MQTNRNNYIRWACDVWEGRNSHQLRVSGFSCHPAASHFELHSFVLSSNYPAAVFVFLNVHVRKLINKTQLTLAWLWIMNTSTQTQLNKQQIKAGHFLCLITFQSTTLCQTLHPSAERSVSLLWMEDCVNLEVFFCPPSCLPRTPPTFSCSTSVWASESVTNVDQSPFFTH